MSEISFPPFLLDVDNERLERDGQEIGLRPKPLAVLSYLAQRPGQLVRKEELLDAIWPETYVTDTVVKVCVREIREALGDAPRTPRYVQTVSRRGYRFIAEVTAAPSRDAPSPDAPSTAVEPRLEEPTVAPRPTPIMVGRKAELGRLETMVEQARQGRRQIVFVIGEPGIGKTTLVDAFLAGLAGKRGLSPSGDQGGETLRAAVGQCQELFGAGEAYMPVLEVLDQLCGGAAGHEVVELLRHRAPSWLLQLPWRISGEEQEELLRRTEGWPATRMLREMVEALEALAEASPLILVLEDLHWSDGSTLDLLSVIARRRGHGRLMVLGTFRPSELEARQHPLGNLLPDLRIQGLCRELPLKLLDAVEVEQYLALRLPDSAPIAALAPLVHQRSDGSPLFVTHLADHLVSLLESEGETALRRLALTRRLEVPDDLRQMIVGLIQLLTPEEQNVLEAASVAGFQFTPPLVAAVLGTDAARVEEVCENLARRGLFLRAGPSSEWPDGTFAGRFEFVHALYQRVLYERGSEAGRVRAHQRLGACLEAAFGERTAEIAGVLVMHFERGRDARRAVYYREQAATTALIRHAYREVIENLRQALARLETLPADSERDRQELALRTALGPALMATQGFTAPDVLVNYSRAQELCTGLDDPPEVFPVMWGQWMFHWMRADYGKAGQIGELCLELARSGEKSSLRLLGHRMLGATFFNRGELEAGRDHLDEALALYDPERDHHLPHFTSDSYVFCHIFRAHLLWLLGRPDEARRSARAACQVAARLSHPFSEALACGLAGTVDHLCGEIGPAREKFERSARLAGTHGFPLLRAATDIRRGLLMVEDGDTDEGFDLVAGGIDAWHLTGAEQWRPLNLMFLATAAYHCGRSEQGLEAVTEALASVEKTNECWCEAELLRLRGELLRAAGAPPADVEACFQAALGKARAQGARAWELRAATSLARLDPCHRGLLGEIVGTFTEGFDTRDLRAAKALVD